MAEEISEGFLNPLLNRRVKVLFKETKSSDLKTARGILSGANDKLLMITDGERTIVLNYECIVRLNIIDDGGD